MRYRGITAAVGALMLAIGGFVSGAGANEPGHQAEPWGFVGTLATANWSYTDSVGNFTGFYVFATEYSGRSNYPGESVSFSFTKIDQSSGTIRFMAGGSNSPDGQLFASAAYATIQAAVPVVECVFPIGDVTTFPPRPGPLPPNCQTWTLQLNLEMTQDGRRDGTRGSIHSNSPDCLVNDRINYRVVPVLATGSITSGEVELTGGIPGTGRLFHEIESGVQIGSCPDPD